MNTTLKALLVKCDEGDANSVLEIIKYYKKQNSATRKRIIKWLVEEINKNDSNFLHHLAALGEEALFKKLLDERATFNNEDNLGNRPIYYATANQHYGIVQLILDADNEYSRRRKKATATLEIFQPNDADETAITIAQRNRDKKALELFYNAKQAFLYDSKRTHDIAPHNTNSKTRSGGGDYTPNWQDVVCADFNYGWITTPTAQIVSVAENGSIDNRFCSGANIGADEDGNHYFLTAGHCLGDVCYALQGSNYTGNYRVSFRYQASVCSTSEQPDIRENTYRILKIAERGTCNGTDYAIFKIEPEAQQRFGHVTLTTDIPAENTDVVLAHHPDGLPKKLSEGKLTSGESKGKIEHSAHTLGGSSGSPIGNRNTHEVFAIHVAGSRDKDKKPDQKTHYGVTIKAIAKESKIVSALIRNSGVFKQPLSDTRVPESLDTSPRAAPRHRY